MPKTKNKTGYIIGIILALLAIVAVVIYGLHLRNKQSYTEAIESPDPSELVLDTADHGLVKEEDTISFETLQEGLNDMGMLITEEYYFTEVVTREKSKELLSTGITIPFTESSYVASYDGVINAGVDFSKINVAVEQVNEQEQITITIPKPEIQTVDIDPDSFVLYSEKTGIGNPFSVEEYNESLKGLESVVKDKAKAKEILPAAEEHAKKLIESFVGSLCAGKDYSLKIVVK